MSVSQTHAAQPTGARADATRAAILETATLLFRSMGYQKTTVADIARELKMSPANVYRFFPSKAAINEALAARLLGGLDELIWGIARGPGSAAERVRRLFQTLQEQTLALFFTEKRLHDMVVAAMDEHWNVIDAHIRSIDTAFRHIVMDGQAAGEFDHLDAEKTGRLLHWATLGFTHPTVVAQCAGDDDLPQLAKEMAEFCLRALRPGS